MTSWVREQYVANYTSDAAAQPPGQVIGDTGGDGVSHRNVCEDDARLSAIGGWADGTTVEVIAVGRGPCDGWLWVETDTVSSWVRDQYVVEPAAAPEPTPTPTTPTDTARRRRRHRRRRPTPTPTRPDADADADARTLGAAGSGDRQHGRRRRLAPLRLP